MYACLYILEIWNVKLYDYPELILIFYRLVTSSKPTKYTFITISSKLLELQTSNLVHGFLLGMPGFRSLSELSTLKLVLSAKNVQTRNRQVKCLLHFAFRLHRVYELSTVPTVITRNTGDVNCPITLIK